MEVLEILARLQSIDDDLAVLPMNFSNRFIEKTRQMSLDVAIALSDGWLIIRLIDGNIGIRLDKELIFASGMSYIWEAYQHQNNDEFWNRKIEELQRIYDTH